MKISLIKVVIRKGMAGYLLREKFVDLMLPITGFFWGFSLLPPRIIGIEPTNRCNLNCLMCPRAYWDKEDNRLGDMPLDLFEAKILPYLKKSQTIILQCLGEPLIADNFFEMLKRTKEKGCRVQFNTNGLLLKETAKRLVELDVDGVTISIDGIKTLKDIRGVDIEKLIEGIHEVNNAKLDLSSKNPVLGIEFVAMEKNVRELPLVIDLAGKLGIKSVNVVHAVIHANKLLEQSLFKHIDLAKKYFDEAYIRARSAGISLKLPPLDKIVKFCRQPFEMIFINWNGDVRPCCISTINEENSITVGNLNDSTLEKIWNNSAMRKLRVSLLRNKGLTRFCLNCALRVNTLESHKRILKHG